MEKVFADVESAAFKVFEKRLLAFNGSIKQHQLPSFEISVEGDSVRLSCEIMGGEKVLYYLYEQELQHAYDVFMSENVVELFDHIIESFRNRVMNAIRNRIFDELSNKEILDDSIGSYKVHHTLRADAVTHLGGETFIGTHMVINFNGLKLGLILATDYMLLTSPHLHGDVEIYYSNKCLDYMYEYLLDMPY